MSLETVNPFSLSLSLHIQIVFDVFRHNIEVMESSGPRFDGVKLDEVGKTKRVERAGKLGELRRTWRTGLLVSGMYRN